MLDRVPGIKKLSEEKRYDPHTQMEYTRRTAMVGDHFAEIHSDEGDRRHHARADGGRVEANMDDRGLFNWIKKLLIG